ncbi:hypothetical protein AVEN_204573-1 [Araneus ventricosus]|uniref:Uncharacterized protein n=1 Tax=Araneus ventricosus TaxID=182803 RepID=A0A4Y2IFM3_ARAVE|nr:hypothetical protein AVEN_204573-1 [Araneus ventricosus]
MSCGPVQWPARSPDLLCLDFCCGPIKTLLYETTVDSVEDLFASMSVASGEMRGMPRIFQNVRNSMRLCCEACVTASG